MVLRLTSVRAKSLPRVFRCELNSARLAFADTLLTVTTPAHALQTLTCSCCKFYDCAHQSLVHKIDSCIYRIGCQAIVKNNFGWRQLCTSASLDAGTEIQICIIAELCKLLIIQLITSYIFASSATLYGSQLCIRRLIFFRMTRPLRVREGCRNMRSGKISGS